MARRVVGRFTANDVFAKLSENERKVSFLHGQGVGDWETTLAWNPAEEMSRSNSSKELLNFTVSQRKRNRLVIGYMSYDFGAKQHGLKLGAKDDLHLPDIYLLAYDNWLTFGNNTATAHYKDPDFIVYVDNLVGESKNTFADLPSVQFKTKIDKATYRQKFSEIQNHIKRGDIYQVNFTHRLEASSDSSSRELFAKLLNANPVGFASYIEGDEFQVLSLSPERFVSIAGQKIVTSPIKGTAPRGADSKVDIANKNSLMASQKEAAELNMITDLLRNDLGKVCAVGTVKVTKQRQLQANRSVWHTYSTVEGTLAKGVTSLDAILSMLPGGSISGVPKKRALEIIDSIEPVRRGAYTGIVGRFEPNGDIDSSIIIRTIIKKGKKLYLQVGGGIVADSKVENEYQETLDKASGIVNILK